MTHDTRNGIPQVRAARSIKEEATSHAADRDDHHQP